MNLFTTILFWAGAILMVDGSLGLIFEERWQKMVRGVNIRRLALIEIGAALSLLVGHYVLAVH